MMIVKSKMGSVFDAMQFKTNNEAGDVNMHAVCIWANQGRGMKARYHCWHDGTNVFVDNVEMPSFNRARADVGDWILKSRGSYDPYDRALHIVTEAGFAELEQISAPAE